MRSKVKRKNKAMGQLLMTLGLFIFGGVILLLHVWLPIQAQRSLNNLKQWEKNLSQKKAELRHLRKKYIQLTSLTSLDQWAQQNGPWHAPREDDVMIIRE